MVKLDYIRSYLQSDIDCFDALLVHVYVVDQGNDIRHRFAFKGFRLLKWKNAVEPRFYQFNVFPEFPYLPPFSHIHGFTIDLDLIYPYLRCTLSPTPRTPRPEPHAPT